MKRREFIRTASAATVALATGIRTRPVAARDAPVPVSEMPRRPLGRSGVQVSILGFGSHTTTELLSQPGKRERQLRHALEHGVTFFHETWDEYPDLTPLPREQGASIMAMKCMGRGALIELARRLRKNPDFQDIPPVSVPEAALRFAWQRPDVAMALPSMFTIDEVRRNVAAARKPGLRADEAELLQRISRAAGNRARSMQFAL